MATSSTTSSTSSSLYNNSVASQQQNQQRNPSVSPRQSPKFSRTYRIAVVGYCSSFQHHHSSSSKSSSIDTEEAGGAGKSCMCQRMVHVGEDEYKPNDHTSVLNLTDFAQSAVINNEHFIYWGCARRVSDDGVRENCFEIVEHTEFVDDSTFQPHRSAKTEAYIKRATRLTLNSPGKLQYFGKNQLGIEQEYPQNLMQRDGTFQIDGFIVCYDVSTSRANMQNACFDGNGGKLATNPPLPASCADQTDLVLKLLQSIVKQKRPVVLATTKNDELYRPLMKEAEKLVGRKEFKGSVPLVETSAHRNVSIQDAFMILAQLIDRSSAAGNAMPLSKVVNYAEACRILGEKCAQASDQFEVLIRLALTATSFQSNTTYAVVKLKLENDEHFRNFVQLFGENCARKKIDQHLQVLRDRQAQLRMQQQLQDLRNVFPKVMPDVRVYTDTKWPSWQDCIKSLPTYHLYFVVTVPNCYHSRASSASTQSSASPLTAVRLSATQSNFVKSPALSNRNSHQISAATALSPSSSFQSLLPESILFHPEAEKHFMAYVGVASARQRHMLACENFTQLLRKNPHVVPGRSLHDVLLKSYHDKNSIFCHDEQFADLGDDKKLELYAQHQRQLIERSKVEFKNYLWENVNVFLHVLLVMPQRSAAVVQQRNTTKLNRLSKKPTNLDRNATNSQESKLSPAHLPSNSSELRSPTAATNGKSLVELQPNSLHAETDMIASLLSSSLPDSDNVRYRALDYLPAERERMLSQHVWLLRSSMPEVCPGPLTYCADLYTASVLDGSVVVHRRSPTTTVDNEFCRPPQATDKNRHKLIVDDRTRTKSVASRICALLLLNNNNGDSGSGQIELDDGLHAVQVGKTNVGVVNQPGCLKNIDDDDACFVYAYDDYDSVRSLFVQLCGRIPPPTTPTAANAEVLQSPSIQRRNDEHSRRRLALIVFNGSPNFSNGAEEDGIEKQADFFGLFQLGCVLAEQLNCVFVQLTPVSNDADDEETADQQLMTSLQSLFHEQKNNMSHLPRCCSKSAENLRRRNFSAATSSSRRPSIGSESLPYSLDGDDVEADLHIRLCFMCGEMNITRHVLMCVLRYYFCARVKISHNTHAQHNRSASFVSSCSLGGVAAAADYTCNCSNKLNCGSLDASAAAVVNIVAPRSIAFDVYLPAPVPGGVADQTNCSSLSLQTLASTTTTNQQQRKRCVRVHLHFTSYHEVLRQLCCSAHANPTSARLTSKKLSKHKKLDTFSSLTQLNTYCSCSQDACNSHVIPDDGFILVYNSARRASFAMARALGSELVAQNSVRKNSTTFSSVMMLAVSNGVEWSQTETDLIRDGIVLCEDLQGRWLTCSLLDPIPKIAFDHFWKSCWERRNAMASLYEAASTATVHSSMNSISMTSSGCGFHYAVPAQARPSVSEHEEEEDFAVENPTYGTTTTNSASATGKLELSDDYDQVDDDDDDEDEDEEQPSAETIVMPLRVAERRQHFAAAEREQRSGANGHHTATWSGVTAAAENESNRDELTGLDSLALPLPVDGSRRPSRTELLRSKFEAELNAVAEPPPPPPTVMRRSAPSNNKQPPQRPTPVVTLHADGESSSSTKRFSASFSGATIPAAAMTTSLVNFAPISAVSDNAVDDSVENDRAEDDDENSSSPPPLPGRLRNSSKYTAIMGQLNVNIQHTPQQKSRFASENVFDLEQPSKPGSAKKKKRKPIFNSTAIRIEQQDDEADGNQISSSSSRVAAPKKISLPLNVPSSSSKTRLSSSPFTLTNAAGDHNSYNLNSDAASSSTAARNGGRRSSRHNLLGADAAWHDDVVQQQQQKSPAVQLLSVKGLPNSRRGSRNEQQLVLPSGSSGGGGKMLPNARFVLPPVSPRVFPSSSSSKQQNEDEICAAPLSPASVGGSSASADKSKRSVGSLFGGGNDSRLRKSFDSKKRSAWKKESKAASNDATMSSAAIVPAETFEELAQQSGSNHRHVPKFIELCIEFIEKDNSVGEKAMELEGLYRIPGNRAQAVTMMNEFLLSVATAKSSKLKSVDEMTNNRMQYTLPPDTAVPTVCTALKMYLNERTPPLLPKRLVDALVHADFQQQTSTAQKIAILKAALNDRNNISHANYAVLRYIAQHLHRVSRCAQQNCMTAKNLSICWWPTMCRLDVPDLFEFEKIRGVLEDAVHVMIEDERKVFCSTD